MIDLDTQKKVWVAIIAGGKGTRLFPISDDTRPKQFCQLDDKDTFIQATAERFKRIGVSEKQIVVVTTNPRQTALATELLVPRGIISTNILEIDARFNYAGAMVVATEFIKSYDQNAIIINTPADQYIGDQSAFEQTIDNALSHYEGDCPIVVGYKTSDIVTAMGCGHVRYSLEGGPLYDMVGEFIEKPDRKLADTLIREENTACNTGINIWSARALLSVITSKDIGPHGLATDDLMNLFSRVKVIVGRFDWRDCGTLRSIYDINLVNATPQHRNVRIGSGRDAIERTRCHNSLFYADKGIEIDAVGIEGAAIIATTVDAYIYIAVVKLSESQEVKKLAEHYAENRDILVDNFQIKGKNNITIPSNLDEAEYRVGFVGVSNHAVYVHKDRNGDIRVAVSNRKAI